MFKFFNECYLKCQRNRVARASQRRGTEACQNPYMPKPRQPTNSNYHIDKQLLIATAHTCGFFRLSIYQTTSAF